MRLKETFERLVRRVARELRQRRRYSLGICYNLYDGEELLESSVMSVRNVAKYVCVVYQDVSNAGERRTDGAVRALLDNLMAKHLVDEIVRYEPDLEEATVNERRKRIIGMKKCREAGCTHYLSMDVDEYYRENELREAFDFIKMNGIDISAVSIIEYVKSPCYRLLYNAIFSPDGENYTFYVPFICKVGCASRFGVFPCPVDGTRDLIRRGHFYLFGKSKIAMHHMSTVRKDLGRKFRNSTLRLINDPKMTDQFNAVEKRVSDYTFREHGADVPEGMDFIGAFPVRKVANEFNVPIE